MVPKQLEPSLELLREEYVLVQAWAVDEEIHAGRLQSDGSAPA